MVSADPVTGAVAGVRRGGRGQAQSQDTGKRVAELGAAVSSVVCGQPA